MNSKLSQCFLITKEFMARPLNIFFSEPVEASDLPNYDKVIEKPMDFVKIESKLSNKEYKKTSEWYNDVCLIYENAIKYHTDETIWGIIAKQLLHDFKKLANGFQIETHEEWVDLVNKQNQKFGDTLSDSPVKFTSDSFIFGCIKRSETISRFPQDKIPELVTNIKSKLKDDKFRAGIIAIIKTMHKEPPIAQEENEITIDIDKLKDQALVAISLYLQSMD